MFDELDCEVCVCWLESADDFELFDPDSAKHETLKLIATAKNIFNSIISSFIKKFDYPFNCRSGHDIMINVNKMSRKITYFVKNM